MGKKLYNKRRHILKGLGAFSILSGFGLGVYLRGLDKIGLVSNEDVVEEMNGDTQKLRLGIIGFGISTYKSTNQ